MPQARPGHRFLTAQLSDEAYARLQDFVGEHGTNMVAFLEALSLRLDDKPPRWLLDVLRDARQLEAQRRRRK